METVVGRRPEPRWNRKTLPKLRSRVDNKRKLYCREFTYVPLTVSQHRFKRSWRLNHRIRAGGILLACNQFVNMKRRCIEKIYLSMDLARTPKSDNPRARSLAEQEHIIATKRSCTFGVEGYSGWEKHRVKKETVDSRRLFYKPCFVSTCVDDDHLSGSSLSRTR